MGRAQRRQHRGKGRRQWPSEMCRLKRLTRATQRQRWLFVYSFNTYIPDVPIYLQQPYQVVVSEYASPSNTASPLFTYPRPQATKNRKKHTSREIGKGEWCYCRGVGRFRPVSVTDGRRCVVYITEHLEAAHHRPGF